MTALLTRDIGPTDTKPARIVVEAGDRPRYYVSRSQYAQKMGWTDRNADTGGNQQ